MDAHDAVTGPDVADVHNLEGHLPIFGSPIEATSLGTQPGRKPMRATPGAAPHSMLISVPAFDRTSGIVTLDYTLACAAAAHLGRENSCRLIVATTAPTKAPTTGAPWTVGVILAAIDPNRVETLLTSSTGKRNVGAIGGEHEHGGRARRVFVRFPNIATRLLPNDGFEFSEADPEITGSDQRAWRRDGQTTRCSWTKDSLRRRC